MNPILLKSGGQRESDGAYLCSIFVRGKLLATEDFGALKRRTKTLMDLVVNAYHALQADVVILEGAGSCTELNLLDRDVVNLPLVVGRLQSPWVLVANIDPGGVFAQIIGTKACVSAAEWDLCVGIVVNKLRGDAKYFEPGPRILQERVGNKPIFVIPYLYNINIAEEDGMGLERKLAREHLLDDQVDETTTHNKTRIVVVCYPHISMTDDLLPVEQDERLQVEWRRMVVPLRPPAAIVLPGSRQTRTDMEWLAQQSPWVAYLRDFAAKGGKILGLCGGYQMLGHKIVDALGIESGTAGTTTDGLGILPVTTTLERAKVVQGTRTATVMSQDHIAVQGFEIHSGQTVLDAEDCDAKNNLGSPLLCWPDDSTDGWIKSTIAGTYLHGILESRDFRSWFFLGASKDDISRDNEDNKNISEVDPLDRLADHVIAHGLDYDTLAHMIGLDEE